MTIQEFIEKAIDGGWKPSDYGNTFYEIMEDFDKEMVEAEADGLFKKEGYELATSYLKYAFTKGREYLILLDPFAWQAVGKVEGWSESEYCVSFGSQHPTLSSQYAGTAYTLGTWQYQMHRMIDALADSKTIEEYLSTL